MESNGMGRRRQQENGNNNNGGATTTRDTPYLRVPTGQLNFFMTRLLFMQEQQADSLGARATNARRMNNSNSSMNFNNSASRMGSSAGSFDHPHHQNQSVDDGGLLGYFDEDPPPASGDDICVYNDNARILPNSRAMSMPPVAFPKAAPESPRQVEGKDGIKVVTPTHQTVDPVKIKAASLPVLPLTNMSLDDDSSNVKMTEQDDDDYVDEGREGPSLIPMQEEEEVDMDVPPPPLVAAKPPATPPAPSSSRKSVTAVPAEARVFPKNQRRSKRYSSRERLPVQRSKSLGRKSDSEGESVVSDDMSLPNMSTHSHT